MSHLVVCNASQHRARFRILRAMRLHERLQGRERLPNAAFGRVDSGELQERCRTSRLVLCGRGVPPFWESCHRRAQTRVYSLVALGSKRSRDENIGRTQSTQVAGEFAEGGYGSPLECCHLGPPL